eukprot:12611204-Alexandrium_andersonii.AAC.1
MRPGVLVLTSVARSWTTGGCVTAARSAASVSPGLWYPCGPQSIRFRSTRIRPWIRGLSGRT